MCQYKHLVEQHEVGRTRRGGGDGIHQLRRAVVAANVPLHGGQAQQRPGPNEHGGHNTDVVAVHMGLAVHQFNPVEEPEGMI